MTEPLQRQQKEVPCVFYDRHTLYGITIAPSDVFQQYDKCPSDRLTTVVNRVRGILLKHLKPVARYVLIVEVSEPRETRRDHGYPRIHFHGMMSLKNPIRYLTECLHHLGKVFSVVVAPYDASYWVDYCAKQKRLMAPELGKSYYLSDLDSEITHHGATDHVVSHHEESVQKRSGLQNDCRVDEARVSTRPRRAAMVEPTIHKPVPSYMNLYGE